MEQRAKEGPGVGGARPSEDQIASECNRPSNQNTDRSKSPSTVLDWALVYAGEMHWHVIPVIRGTRRGHKSAEYSNGRRWGATADPDEIRQDFRKWRTANVGIPTGKINGIFVIDADTVEGHNVDGIANLKALEDRHGALPDTLTAVSPTGSTHKYFNHPGGDVWIKNSTSEIAEGVDIRGDGGMVIAPPSVKTDVGDYRWSNWGKPIADPPQWLLDLVIEKDLEPTDPTEAVDIAVDADLFELSYAMEVIPNGDDVHYREWKRRGMSVWRATAGSEDGFKIFDAYSMKWHGYNEDNTRKAWDQITGSPPTKVTGRTIFYLADQARPGWRTEAKVAKLNLEYAFVLAGDKGAVMKFEGRTFRLLKKEAFKDWHANKGVIKVGKKFVTIGEAWLKHPMRREYAGIEFDPTDTSIRKDYYNLWRGFAVEPRQGDCSLFLAHIKDNVAQGDEAIYRWVIGWFADIIQNPGRKQGTSLALRGKQGVGKTIVGKIIGSLIGDHYDLVDAPRYVVGNFNAHMASLLLLQADEAFWAGDKQAEGVLKNRITGDWAKIEFKHVDPIKVRNFMRLLVTSNSDWVVPAGFGERRFAILDVDTAHAQDHPYFEAIEDQMDDGGREALMHYLRNFDLSTVNLRSVPTTSALLEQQIASMTPEQSWWLDVLKGGQLPQAIDTGTADNPGKIQNSCFTSELYDSYIQHSRRRGVSRKVIDTQIGMFLSKVVGSNLRKKRADNTTRDRYYIFPPLKECRELFAEEMRNDNLEWDDRQKDWDHVAGGLWAA